MTKPDEEKELQPLEKAQRCQRKHVNPWIREAVSVTPNGDRLVESQCKDPGTDGAVNVWYRERL